MNQDENIHNNQDEPEVQEVETDTKPRNERTKRTALPRSVNELEDPRAYARFVQQLYREYNPITSQQESDLEAFARLRWILERLNNLVECELNHRVNLPSILEHVTANARLMFAYRRCMADKTYLRLTKERLDTLKVLNTVSTRMQRWPNPQIRQEC